MRSAIEVGRRICRRILDRTHGRYLLRRFRRGEAVHLDGLAFATDPEVLHPIYFRSTRVLLDAILHLALPERRFLDMGAGSGVIGMFAASHGARVTACDINPKAVALARANFARNGLDGEVLQSDLFAALGGRTFDLIAFNLPYLTGEARTPFEAALFGGRELETVRRFARGCAEALVPDGAVWVVFSEDADGPRILAAFADAGLRQMDHLITHRLFERFHVASFRRS